MTTYPQKLERIRLARSYSKGAIRLVRAIETVVFILVATSLSQSGCAWSRSRSIETEFFKLPLEEQYRRFANYSYGAQYDIYTYGCDKLEPPELSLAKTFAAGGEPVATLLTEKLKEANDDRAIVNIVSVLYWINRLNTFDLRDDVGLKALLTRKIDAMKIDEWKQIAERDFKEIYSS
jgi:hypothetical protein